MITDEQRKLLTKWLVECWHELSCIDGVKRCSCGVVGNLNIVLAHTSNRTFDNWTDFGAVFERLGYYKARKYAEQAANDFLAGKTCSYKERFCILVAEAIEAGVIK